MKKLFLPLIAIVLFLSCETPDRTVFVETITLNQTQLTKTVGDPAVTLATTISPSNVTEKDLTWQSEDTRIATVDNNGRVTAVAQGQTRIWVQDGFTGANASISVTITPGTGSVTGVELRNTLMLGIGDTETLIPTFTPENPTNRNVTWRSNNNQIATVDANGLVTARARGNAVITVTTEDGNHTATCSVTVVTQIIAVTGVTLNISETMLAVGDTETLKATIAPTNATNRNVIWTSGNTSVATVDENGVITAVSIGEATITATTEDGYKTDTCVVTVVNEIIPVTAVNLNVSEVELVVGRPEMETVTLIATVIPENANNQNVTWASNHPLIAMVDDSGVVTAISVGQTHIWVRTEDGNRAAHSRITVRPPFTVSNPIGSNRILPPQSRHAFGRLSVQGGCTGTMSFQWQQSTDGQTWVNAEGTNTNSSYTTPPLSVSMYYRQIVTDACGFSIVSAPALVEIDEGVIINGVRWGQVNALNGFFNVNVGVNPCPIGWRLPSVEDFQSLIDAGSVWTTQNGVNGRLFGSGSNTVFFPANGLHTITDVGNNLQSTTYVGVRGFYSANDGFSSDSPRRTTVTILRFDNEGVSLVSNFVTFSQTPSQVSTGIWRWNISARCVKE